jgi:hypothetical protein
MYPSSPVGTCAYLGCARKARDTHVRVSHASPSKSVTLPCLAGHLGWQHRKRGGEGERAVSQGVPAAGPRFAIEETSPPRHRGVIQVGHRQGERLSVSTVTVTGPCAESPASLPLHTSPISGSKAGMGVCKRRHSVRALSQRDPTSRGEAPSRTRERLQ